MLQAMCCALSINSLYTSQKPHVKWNYYLPVTRKAAYGGSVVGITDVTSGGDESAFLSPTLTPRVFPSHHRVSQVIGVYSLVTAQITPPTPHQKIPPLSLQGLKQSVMGCYREDLFFL